MTVVSPKLLIRLLLAVSLVTLIIGCSSDMISNPVSTDQTDSEILTESIPLPTWTEEDIANLLPGYQVLSIDSRAAGTSDQLDDQTSLFIRRTQGGTVSHRNNGVQVGAWQLWEDRTVTVSTPNPGTAIVDFAPHPYQFNGHVRIWIDLTYIQLPPGMNWWDIQMFYMAEDGTVQQFWGYVDHQARQYIAWTDHFSRYILAVSRTQ